MPHSAAFHLGLHCFPKYKYTCQGVSIYKGLILYLPEIFTLAPNHSFKRSDVYPDAKLQYVCCFLDQNYVYMCNIFYYIYSVEN